MIDEEGIETPTTEHSMQQIAREGTEPPSGDAPPGKLLTLAEAAEILGMKSGGGVKQAIAKGKFPGAFKTEPQGRATKGLWLVPESEVLAYARVPSPSRGVSKPRGERAASAPPPIPRNTKDPILAALLQSKRGLEQAKEGVAQAERAVSSALSAYDKRQAKLKEAIGE